MKHSLFLLTILLILTGCGQQISPINHNTQEVDSSIQSGFFDLPPDTGTYPDPKIHITLGTGTVLAEFGSKVENEISRTASEEDKQNGRKWSVVSGYLYTYTYTDLGINITTPANYEPYFSTKTNERIYGRHKNMIYNAQRGNNGWGDYIALFTKHPKTPLFEEIQAYHLGTGCIIETGILNEKTTHYTSMIGFDVVYLGDKDRQTPCTYDTQFPQREMPLVFVMDPKHPETYYKLAIGDGCAPGPCSIFGTIEFLD